MALDAAGDLFIADTSNNIVREVFAKTIPTVSLSPSEDPALYGQSLTYTATVTNAGR